MTIQRNIAAHTGAVAVSIAKQADATTAAALARSWSAIDKSVIVSDNRVFQLLSNRATIGNGVMQDIFYQGNLSPVELTFTFPELNVDQLIFALAYVLGDPNAAAQIGSTASYSHTGNLQASTTVEQPYFSALFMRGDETTGVDKILMYGGQGNSVTISWERTGQFIKGSMTAHFLGKFKRNILREIIYGSSQATSLTLSARAVEGDDAAGRLKAIHSCYAGLDGFEKSNLKDVEPTAISDATPAVLTIPKAWSAVTQCYTDDGTTITNGSNGATAVVLALDTTKYLYVGHYSKFNALYFGSSVVNANAAVIDIEYFKSNGAWTNVSDPLDNTAAGGVTLAGSGDMFWNLPTDWEPCMLPYSQSALLGFSRRNLYWVRISAGATLTATTAATVALSRYENCVAVKFSDNGSFTDYDTEASSMDGSEFPAVQITTAQDYVYFAANGTSCARCFVEIGDTPNAVAATTMTVEYYNGAWTDLVGSLSDGTDPGDGVSMSQSGVVSWTQPTDHVKSEIDSEEQYWFRMSWDKTLTAGAYFEGLRVGDRYLPFEIVYRAEEGAAFSEGDTLPAETIQPPFSVTGIQTFLAPNFDGTQMDGGRLLACEQVSGEITIKRNNSVPIICLDGTLDKFPKKHGTGQPEAMGKVVMEANRADWELINAMSNENSSAVETETVRRLSLGIRMTGSVIDTDNPELRYQAEIIFPLVALKSHAKSEADDKYLVTLEFEVGEDTANSYSPVYYRCISDTTTSYAQ